MAETDRFLLDALAQSGCLPASATGEDATLANVSSEMLLAVVWKCLACLQAASQMDPAKLAVAQTFEAPRGVAARHRMGSQFATSLKELGYAGDCGYNHFLYPTEKETRNILSWLVGKLPRTMHEDAAHSVALGSASTTPGVAGANATSMLDATSLAAVFSGWRRKKTLYMLPHRQLSSLQGFARLPLHTTSIQLPWCLPSRSTQDGYLLENCVAHASKAVSVLEAMAIAQRNDAFGLDTLAEGLPEDVLLTQDSANAAVESGADETSEDASQDQTASAILQQALEESEREGSQPFDVGSGGVVAEGFLAMDLEVGDPQLVQPHSPVEVMHARLVSLQQQVESARADIEREADKVRAAEKHVEQTKTVAAQLKREMVAQQQLATLVPQAAESVAKLEGICASSEGKLQELAQQWESIRAPLLEEEKALTSIKSTRKARCRQLVSEMKTFRAEMQTMTAALHDKQLEMHALAKAHAALPANGNHRDTYTSRIMDIITQVHKQKAEIRKVLEDIRVLQKQLNVSSEKLKRSEALAEDKLFGEASRHIKPQTSSSSASSPECAYLDCYRKFAQVRELFEELILVVADVGKQENLARDLDNWITQLQSRDSLRHLERVLRDVQSVRQENAALLAQLHAA